MSNISQLLKANKIILEEQEYEVQMIHYSKLHRSPYQFYVERDIEQFADELEVAGQILQPLVVREINIGTYEIIAGHRRNLSSIYNYEQKEIETFKKLPCYVIDVDNIMAEYLVIKTNATREKDAWEIMHEIERLKYLIPRLPVNKNMKGRLQEYVVNELGLTKSVVGRYEHVAKELVEEGKERLRRGKLNISVANKLASLDKKLQRELLAEHESLTLALIHSFLEMQLHPVPQLGTNNDKQQVEDCKNRTSMGEHAMTPSAIGTHAGIFVDPKTEKLKEIVPNLGTKTKVKAVKSETLHQGNSETATHVSESDEAEISGLGTISPSQAHSSTMVNLDAGSLPDKLIVLIDELRRLERELEAEIGVVSEVDSLFSKVRYEEIIENCIRMQIHNLESRIQAVKDMKE